MAPYLLSVYYRQGTVLGLLSQIGPLAEVALGPMMKSERALEIVIQSQEEEGPPGVQGRDES